jgi:hypothetical protein
MTRPRMLSARRAGGTRIAAPGQLLLGPIAARSSSSRVLGNRTGARISSTGGTVVAKVGASSQQTSPAEPELELGRGHQLADTWMTLSPTIPRPPTDGRWPRARPRRCGVGTKLRDPIVHCKAGLLTVGGRRPRSAWRGLRRLSFWQRLSNGRRAGDRGSATRAITVAGQRRESHRTSLTSTPFLLGAEVRVRSDATASVATARDGAASG